MGAVLGQVDANGNEYAVAFASLSCNDAKKTTVVFMESVSQASQLFNISASSFLVASLP